MMKKTIFSVLVVLSVIALVVRFGYKPLQNLLGLTQPSGVKITSTPQAKVFIAGEEVGTTPYQNDNLKPEEYSVTLKTNDGSWQGRIKLIAGTISWLNREIASNMASSSGEILNLSQGSGLLINSDPSSAQVEIDGKSYGITPVFLPEISGGEHNIMLFKDGYLKRSLQARVPGGFMLAVNVDLALTEADLSQFSPSALFSNQTLLVLPTPLGFLRVREKPSIVSMELGKAKSGDKLTWLSDANGWYRVKTDSGLEGYVSASYVRKI